MPRSFNLFSFLIILNIFNMCSLHFDVLGQVRQYFNTEEYPEIKKKKISNKIFQQTQQLQQFFGFLFQIFERFEFQVLHQDGFCLELYCCQQIVNAYYGEILNYLVSTQGVTILEAACSDLYEGKKCLNILYYLTSFT